MDAAHFGTLDWEPLAVCLAAGKLAAITGACYYAVRWLSDIAIGRPRFDERRLAVMVILTAAVIAAQIGAGVLSGEPVPLDRALLEWIHSHSSGALIAAANAVTLTGSWRALVPLALLSVCGLLAVRRRREAWYVAACAFAGIALTVALKAAFGRERPALWDHDVYWGSSFPSGHTLNTTCIAGALAVCAAHLWPRARPCAEILAGAWTLAVGLSRMVLGVHWPTDVAAAASIGVTVAAVLSLCFLPKRRTRISQN